MNQEQINTIDLSDVTPVEFSWNESDMSTDFAAQEVGPYITTATLNTTSSNIVTINSGIGITHTGFAASNPGYTISTPFDDIVDRLSKLEQIIAEENEVRKNHPAVQMAYDEYRLLYILAKKNPGDHLTDL